MSKQLPTITAAQRSTEWHEQRKGRVTGSVAGAILGLNPFMSPEQALRRMVRDYHNVESEFTGNIATEYGSLNEPIAQLAYTTKTGNLVNECGFSVHPEHQWLGASPDGLIESDNGELMVLEIKCPFSKRNDLIPEFKSIYQQKHYYAQLQLEMACTGTRKAHFYQWNRHVDSVEMVFFDNSWFNDALPKLRAFYELYLSELNNPAHLESLTPEISTPEAVALLTEYDQVSEAIENAQARKVEIIEALAKIADNKTSVINGRKFSQITRQGAISYAKAIKDLLPNADLTKYQGKPTSYWKLG